jgi:signal transduction histidine kinase
VHLSQDFKEKLLDLDAKTEELLEQMEYKAVLDERTRLAREIHDGLAQTLAFLKMEAARMQTYVSKGDVEALSRTLQACYQTLSDAYLDARQAIDNLRRVPDERLSDWLELTAADFTAITGIEVDVSNIQIAHVFSPGIKAQLVRIVQEALTNVRKHAQACQVTISLPSSAMGLSSWKCATMGVALRLKRHSRPRNMGCVACVSAPSPLAPISRSSVRRAPAQLSVCKSRSGRKPAYE